MTKLQNLFVALVNMDIFQMTLKLSLFTELLENLVVQDCEPAFVYADMQNVCRCMQVCMYTFPGLHCLN